MGYAWFSSLKRRSSLTGAARHTRPVAICARQAATRRSFTPLERSQAACGLRADEVPVRSHGWRIKLLTRRLLCVARQGGTQQITLDRIQRFVWLG